MQIDLPVQANGCGQHKTNIFHLGDSPTSMRNCKHASIWLLISIVAEFFLRKSNDKV